MTMDINDLQAFVEKVKLEIKMTYAAIIIQKGYRRYLQRKLDEYKDKCASKLQRQWKLYRLR